MMQNDQEFEADTQRALSLSIDSMRVEDKEYISFKRTHDMTDLEEFQERDKRYCKDLELAIVVSKTEHEEAKKKKEVIQQSNQHFDNEFLPFINGFSISFEAFCIIILRGYSGRCGSCAVYRDKRYQSTSSAEEIQDAMHDFCPHLICSEWNFVAKMRSISKVFWERFLETRPGRYFTFCLPQCKYCYWTDLYDCGAAEKMHCVPTKLNLTLSFYERRGDFTPKCLCISVEAPIELRKWCQKVRLSEERILIKRCTCGNVRV